MKMILRWSQRQYSITYYIQGFPSHLIPKRRITIGLGSNKEICDSLAKVTQKGILDEPRRVGQVHGNSMRSYFSRDWRHYCQLSIIRLKSDAEKALLTTSRTDGCRCRCRCRVSTDQVRFVIKTDTQPLFLSIKGELPVSI